MTTPDSREERGSGAWRVRLSRGSATTRALSLAAALALATWAVGCDTQVAVLADGGEAAFALSGFLDAGADTQFVRVEALRPFLNGPDRTLQGTVESSGPDGGRQVWRDSTLLLEDGAAVTLAYAAFRPAPGEHTVVVRADDGARATATVTIPPPLLLADLGLTIVQPDPADPPTAVEQNLSLGGATTPPGAVTARYYVRVEAEGGARRTYERDYTDQLRAESADRYRLALRLRRDRFAAPNALGFAGDTALRLDSLVLVTQSLGPAYSAARSGPDATPRNLTGAVGFVGGIGTYRYRVALSAATREAAGYRTDD